MEMMGETPDIRTQLLGEAWERRLEEARRKRAEALAARGVAPLRAPPPRPMPAPPPRDAAAEFTPPGPSAPDPAGAGTLAPVPTMLPDPAPRPVPGPLVEPPTQDPPLPGEDLAEDLPPDLVPAPAERAAVAPADTGGFGKLSGSAPAADTTLDTADDMSAPEPAHRPVDLRADTAPGSPTPPQAGAAAPRLGPAGAPRFGQVHARGDGDPAARGTPLRRAVLPVLVLLGLIGAAVSLAISFHGFAPRAPEGTGQSDPTPADAAAAPATRAFLRPEGPQRDAAGFVLDPGAITALGYPAPMSPAGALAPDAPFAALRGAESDAQVALLHPVEGAAAQLVLPGEAALPPPLRPDPAVVRARQQARARAAALARQSPLERAFNRAVRFLQTGGR